MPSNPVNYKEIPMVKESWENLVQGTQDDTTEPQKIQPGWQVWVLGVRQVEHHNSTLGVRNGLLEARITTER